MGSIVSTFNFFKTGTISINISASGNGSLNLVLFIDEGDCKMDDRQDFPFKRKLNHLLYCFACI